MKRKANGWGTEIQQAMPYSPEPAVPSWSSSGRRRQYPVSAHCCGWSGCWRWWPHPHLQRYKLWRVTQPYALVLWAYKEGFKHFFLTWYIYILFSKLKYQDIKICSLFFCQHPPPNMYILFFFLTGSNLKSNWTSKISVLKKQNYFIHKLLSEINSRRWICGALAVKWTTKI